MATIELRESDKRRVVNLNRKNGYGLDNVQMMRLINAHQKGDVYKRVESAKPPVRTFKTK